MTDSARPLGVDSPGAFSVGSEGEDMRLAREARRLADRLQFSAVIEAFGAGTALAKWASSGWTNVPLLIAAVGAVVAIPITLIVRRQQLRRAWWFETTDRWWERLDELPRMEPFPRLVDFVERRLFRRSA